MAAPVGNKFAKGRPKGSVNKRTTEAIEIAERVGCDPFELLLYFAKGDWKALGYKSGTVTKVTNNSVVEEDVITAELRASSAKAACEYLYPKRKAVEQSFSDDTVQTITRTILSKKV